MNSLLNSPTTSQSMSEEVTRPDEEFPEFKQTDTAHSPNVINAGGTLRSLFWAHKRQIVLTYGLFNLENLLRLAQPFVLGLAINGLLHRTYTGLMIFVVQHLLHMLVGSFRQMYDTRVFSSVYTDLATEMVVGQRNRHVDVSRVAARSALSRNYVEFFEQYVPMLIRALYSVVGALVLLGMYDWTLIPFCLALVVPAVLLNMAYGRKSYELSGKLHDQFEQEVDVITQCEPQKVRDHYNELARWRIKLSDAEAINFSLMELFVLGVMVATLVQFCRNSSPQPGDIFAVFRYVLMFIMGLDSAPKLVQQLSRLRDIGFRLARNECSVHLKMRDKRRTTSVG